MWRIVWCHTVPTRCARPPEAPHRGEDRCPHLGVSPQKFFRKSPGYPQVGMVLAKNTPLPPPLGKHESIFRCLRFNCGVLGEFPHPYHPQSTCSASRSGFNLSGLLRGHGSLTYECFLQDCGVSSRLDLDGDDAIKNTLRYPEYVSVTRQGISEGFAGPTRASNVFLRGRLGLTLLRPSWAILVASDHHPGVVIDLVTNHMVHEPFQLLL